MSRPNRTPDRVQSEMAPDTATLARMGRSLREHEVSRETRLLFGKKACQPPPLRLKGNLAVVMGQLLQGPVHKVLPDALTPDEHRALYELDIKKLPVKVREVAHGLLNIHERWCLLRAFSKTFGIARDSQGEFIVIDRETQ